MSQTFQKAIEPSNYVFLSLIKSYSIFLFLPVHFTNHYSSSAHVTTLSSFNLRFYFSHWSVAKSQWGSSVLSWIKQDYWILTWGERLRKKIGRWEFPWVMKLHQAPFSLPFCPCRVFYRGKAVEATKILLHLCVFIHYDISVCSHVADLKQS